jgi:hypothetical protein
MRTKASDRGIGEKLIDSLSCEQAVRRRDGVKPVICSWLTKSFTRCLM